ncbi:MAG TPA: hypothetical protein VNR00_12015 [Opitutus sp.]|nr:hypothetical protein [Opitutus sp.]
MTTTPAGNMEPLSESAIRFGEDDGRVESIDAAARFIGRDERFSV